MSHPGRIRHFLLNWEKLTNDKNILDVVTGLELKFLENPYQAKNPKQICCRRNTKGARNSRIIDEGSNQTSDILLRPVSSGRKKTGAIGQA